MLLRSGLSAFPSGQLLYLIRLAPAVKSTRREVQNRIRYLVSEATSLAYPSRPACQIDDPGGRSPSQAHALEPATGRTCEEEPTSGEEGGWCSSLGESGLPAFRSTAWGEQVITYVDPRGPANRGGHSGVSCTVPRRFTADSRVRRCRAVRARSASPGSWRGSGRPRLRTREEASGRRGAAR